MAKAKKAKKTYGQETVIKNPVTPMFQWQKEVFLCEVLFRICCCGRGSGKTKLAIDDMLMNMAYEYVGNACIICPKSKDQTTLLYWERLKEACLQYPGAVDISQKWYNDGRHYLTLKNGSIIYLMSGNEQAAEGLRGSERTYILLDEMAGLARSVWDYIIYPMSARGCLKKMLFASTPNGQGDLFHDLYKYGLWGAQGDPKYKMYRSFHVSSYANTTQKVEVLDAIREQYGEKSLVWRREYLAEFVGTEGAVFPNFNELNTTTKAVYYNTNDWTTYAAVDFGFTKGVTILFQINRFTNNLNIFSEYYNINRGFGEERSNSLSQKQHLVKGIKDYKIKNVFVDCAGNQRSQETGKSMVGLLRQAGINNIVPVTKQHDDFRNYTEQIRSIIKDGKGQPHLFIHPDNCKYGVESFYNLKYPDQSKVIKDAHKYLKDGIYDHYIDAFRYAIKVLYPVGNTGQRGHNVELL